MDMEASSKELVPLLPLLSLQFPFSLSMSEVPLASGRAMSTDASKYVHMRKMLESNERYIPN